jgi:hypothetical protein
VSVVRALVLAGIAAIAAFAHVGSPDVFFQGNAGPYSMLVAIRPPEVIPGVARVEVRVLSPGVQEVELTPTPMRGEAARHPPVADIAERSATDPQAFDGSLWLMATGSWKVRVHASGPQGSGELQVPVPAVALRMQPMAKDVTYFLIGMMIFLTVGMVAIVGAGIRESRLEPGLAETRWTGKAIAGMVVASALLIVGLWQGNAWWGEEASAASQKIYTPLGITASLQGADRLQLHVTDPGWIIPRKLDDLALDHGHLMHLFLVRWPDMDRMYHLHPEQTATGYFEIGLPTMPKGTYRVYGDIVHESGFAETAVGETSLPEIVGKPLSGDDAGGVTAPVNADSFPLADGYKMVLTRDKTNPISAKTLNLFTFSIVGPDGKPVGDLEPYMGMGGHAEFVKTDGSVFAHVHPSGSVSMASVAIASPDEMMAMHQTNIGSAVSFPYGLPTPGRYRIFVQLKRAGKVATGAFDLSVS